MAASGRIEGHASKHAWYAELLALFGLLAPCQLSRQTTTLLLERMLCVCVEHGGRASAAQKSQMRVGVLPAAAVPATEPVTVCWAACAGDKHVAQW